MHGRGKGFIKKATKETRAIVHRLGSFTKAPFRACFGKHQAAPSADFEDVYVPTSKGKAAAAHSFAANAATVVQPYAAVAPPAASDVSASVDWTAKEGILTVHQPVSAQSLPRDGLFSPDEKPPAFPQASLQAASSSATAAQQAASTPSSNSPVSKASSVSSSSQKLSSCDEEEEAFPSERHATSLIGQYFEIGESVYEIDGWLGEGASSSVVKVIRTGYAGACTGSGFKYAAKLFKGGSDGIEQQAEEEADLMRTLKSCSIPHTAEFVDYGMAILADEDEEYNVPVLVMRLARGQTVEDYVEGVLDEREDYGPPSSNAAADHMHIVRQIGAQICKTSAEMLRAGVVDPDCKPENFMVHFQLLRGRQACSTTKIDFGACAFLDAEGRITAKDAKIGTPLYMSPEVVARCLDPRLATKVQAEPLAAWGLGLILFELLTLTPFPFRKPGRDIELGVDGLLGELQTLLTAWDGHSSREQRCETMRSILQPHVPEEAVTEAADLLAGLLHVEPHRRLTLQQAAGHPFFET